MTWSTASYARIWLTSRANSLAFLSLVALPAAHGQGAVVKALPAHVDRLPDSVSFRRIVAVRELSRGRLLVSDVGRDRLTVVNWQDGSARAIGPRGRAEGEFRGVGALFPGRGDTTYMDDPAGHQWVIFVGSDFAGVVAGSTDRPAHSSLRGVSLDGRFLELLATGFSTSPGVKAARIRPFATSLVAMARRIDAVQVDTVTELRGSFIGAAELTKEVSGPPMRYLVWNPLGVEDQCLLLRDGWIAVVRTGPYRVEWISPSGTRAVFSPTTARTVVDEKVKRLALARVWFGPFLSLIAPSEMPGWPTELPPFLNDALIAIPDGRLLIQRASLGTEGGEVYDVVSRDGTRAFLRLKNRETVVGVGERHVYVAVKDDNRALRLERRPWQ